MEYEEIVAWLKANENAENVAGMARFGIRAAKVYGISMPELRKMARRIGTDQRLAERLWNEGSHEARTIAAGIADPNAVTEEQAEAWAASADNWATCDNLCAMCLWRTPFAYELTDRWSNDEREFVKRAAYALMAVLAWKDKQASDDSIATFLPLIEREAGDRRPMVRKAVNWALRQVGKRNASLNAKAIEAAQRILDSGVLGGKWIANDALKELRSDKVRERLGLA